MKSQNKQILEYLKNGNSITPIEALNLFGSFRLGARIKDLRDGGHNIITELVKDGRKRYAKYSLKVRLDND